MKLRCLPKLWGGPPGPRASPWTRSLTTSSHGKRAGEGVGSGPGVRPTIYAKMFGSRKSMWH